MVRPSSSGPRRFGVWAWGRPKVFVAFVAFAVTTSFVGSSRADEPHTREERTFGLALNVAEPDNVPVRPDTWLDAQIAEAERLFSPVGVHFRWTVRKIGKRGREKAETREDRDAFVDSLEPGLVNVFVVQSLRDVDEPTRMRMGVCWTETTSKRRYIVLSSTAKPSVLAHELGHFFGNGHTQVVNNLMSYDRDGGEVFLDLQQKGRIVELAERFARGALTLLGPARSFH